MKKEKSNKRISQKKKTMIVGITIVAIILVLLIILGLNLEKDTDNKEYKTKVDVNTPLIYVNDDKQLKYCTFSSPEPHTILGGVELDDAGLYLYELKDKNKFSFSTMDSLYLIDKKNIDNGMKLVNGFTSYKRNDDYFVYSLDTNLYVLNINTNEKNKVDSNITSITNITDKYYTYIKDEYEYLKVFDDNNIKIKLGRFNNSAQDYTTTIIKISDKYDQVLYYDYDNTNSVKKNKLTIYNILGDTKNVVTDDCDNVYYYSADFSKIGYTEVSHTKSAAKYAITYNVNIDKIEEKLFNGEDNISYHVSQCDDNPDMYCYYIENGDSYRTVELTKEEFDEISMEFKLDDDDRDYNISTYDAYFYDAGDSEKLIENVDYVDHISSNKDVSYKRIGGNRVNINKYIYDKCGNDCLETIDDAVSLLKYDVYYKKYKQKENLIEANTNPSTGIRELNNYKVLAIYNEPNRSYYLLNEKSNVLKKGEMIIQDGIDYYERLGYKDDGFFFFENYNYEKQIGDLYLFRNNKKEHIADEIYIESVLIKNNNVYFVENFDFDLYSGTFSKYNLKEKRKEKIIDNVNRGYYVADNKYFIMKDYSTSNNTFDLYSYNKDKLNVIEYSVKGMNWVNFVN